MLDPTFEIGTKVEVELSPGFDNFRYGWDLLGCWFDRGPSGKYIEGAVRWLRDQGTLAVLHFTHFNNSYDDFILPLKGSSLYVEGQFELPGFFNVLGSYSVEAKCECGVWKVYGKDYTGHASYCPLYTKNPYTGM